MAGIATATAAQVLAARDTTFRLARELQALVDGSQPAGVNITAANVTRIDALVDAHAAALALINT